MQRKPVVSPELVQKPEMQAIAGWVSLTVELSAGDAGLRHLMVTLDASGTPISGGDTVLYVAEPEDERGPARYINESIGGRIEADGSFRGTCWRTVILQYADQDEGIPIESVSSAPTAEEAASLLALVAEILRLAPGS